MLRCLDDECFLFGHQYLQPTTLRGGVRLLSIAGTLANDWHSHIFFVARPKSVLYAVGRSKSQSGAFYFGNLDSRIYISNALQVGSKWVGECSGYLMCLMHRSSWRGAYASV